MASSPIQPPPWIRFGLVAGDPVSKFIIRSQSLKLPRCRGVAGVREAPMDLISGEVLAYGSVLIRD